MSKTHADLMEAFAGESQANRKYLAFAAQAEKEGCSQAAKLFRAAAENLQAAIAGETHECTVMYPAMIEDAKNEEEKAIAKYFEMVCKVEGIHAELYKDAAKDPKADGEDYYICPVCGYIHKGKYEGKCPVCGADGSKFYTVK